MIYLILCNVEEDNESLMWWCLDVYDVREVEGLWVADDEFAVVSLDISGIR